jgi:hypothetical protein
VRVEGDDLGLSRNQNFIDTFTYRMYMFGGDGRIFNFSDVSDVGNQCSLPHSYWWAQRCNRPDWTWFENQHVIPWGSTGGVFHAVEAFWYRPAFPDSSEPALEPLKHFQGLDWVVWRGERTWLAFRGGFNGGNHCNRDLGHFIFGAGQDRFLIDPGYGANHAGQHNSVTIRHQDQTDCATAPVFRLRPRPGGFYLACDLSDAFPHSLAFYYRHLLLIDDTHLLVVDDLLGRAGRRIGAAYHLQTCCPVQCTDDTLRLEGQEHTLAVRRLAPSDTPEVQDAEWRRRSYTVVSWHDASDRIHAVHPVLFSLAPAEASFSRQDDVLSLHLNGDTYRIDLAEGSLVLAH